MLRAILVLVLAVTGQAGTQQPPTFRSDAYVVSFEIDITTRRGLFGRTRPYTDLVAADFGVILDGKRFDAVSFTPPDEHRDGKEHQVRLRIKRWDTPVQKSVVFPQPTGQQPEADALR